MNQDWGAIDYFRDPAVIDDPNPYFDHIRGQCPVFREPHHGVLMVTGYEEAMEMFNKKRDAFSACVTVTGPIPPLPFTPEGDDISDQIREHRSKMPWNAVLVCYDGAEHMAIRTMLTSVLTQTRLKKNEEYLRSLADRLIDKFIDRGRCEFISEYANALSTLVIADLLGVPEEDRDQVLDLLGPNPAQIGGDPESKLVADPFSALDSLFTKYMRERRGNPSHDMMSEFANSRFKDGTLPELSIAIRLAKFLFGAGQDTSARLMAASLKVLGECPEIQQRLRAERHRIPDFIEESLRYDAPVKVISRLAKCTTTIGQVPVPAGTIMTVALGAVGRDTTHFERPNEFDIDRASLRDHFAFGRGAHACPGAPLARSETRITLERFLERTSDIRISEAEHGPPGARRFEFEPSFMLRGLRELHLEFKRA